MFTYCIKKWPHLPLHMTKKAARPDCPAPFGSYPP